MGLSGAKYRLITPRSPEFGMSGFLTRAALTSNTTWNVANDPLAMPFRVQRPTIVTKFGWINGPTVSTNWDMGIYDSAFNRLASCGSTARVGASVWQFVDITDLLLTPEKLYYLVGVNNATTGSNVRAWITSVNLNQILGILDSTTDAFPLPDPLTNMGLASSLTRIPDMAMLTTGMPS